WYCLRYRPRVGADHRKASSDGFGIGHTVTLETRGEDEHVGRGVKLGKLMRRHFTQNGNSIAEPMTRDVRIKRSGRVSVTRAIADDRQTPGEFGKRPKGGDQHIKALPWHDRSN